MTWLCPFTMHLSPFIQGLCAPSLPPPTVTHAWHVLFLFCFVFLWGLGRQMLNHLSYSASPWHVLLSPDGNPIIVLLY
jgi:hypothetical protein